MNKIGKTSHIILMISILMVVFLIHPQVSRAGTFNISNAASGPFGVGDFSVSGGSSPAGETLVVLSLQTNGSESGDDSFSMGDLWSTLDDGGVGSTNTLGFVPAYHNR